ncbi:uncharacterized protein [Eurosta solidaginis]|uniref:uncharacterized protein n=1 Tax=Eurosta solidaginis TaxID=178769 RepID=UPI0035313F52
MPMNRQRAPVPTPRRSLASQVTVPTISPRNADAVADYRRCRLCMRHHALSTCPLFTAMEPQQRAMIARAHKYCTNCLALSHHTSVCTSRERCHVCGLHHHTLLHRETGSRQPPQPGRHHRQSGRQAPTEEESHQQSRRRVATHHRRRRQQQPARSPQRAPTAHPTPRRSIEERTIRCTATGLRTATYKTKVGKILIQEAVRALQELKHTLGA